MRETRDKKASGRERHEREERKEEITVNREWEKPRQAVGGRDTRRVLGEKSQHRWESGRVRMKQEG